MPEPQVSLRQHRVRWIPGPVRRYDPGLAADVLIVRMPVSRCSSGLRQAAGDQLKLNW